MNFKHSRTIFLVASIIINSACFDDVPHNNPLDPENNNQGYKIDGFVKSYYAPFRNLPNAVITLLPQNTKVFSGLDGTFTFPGLKPGSYTIICTTDGYDTDSTEIDLDSNKSVEFFLDGLPFFENISITTRHISRFFPVDDIFWLRITANVTDPDGIADIDNVSFEIPDLAVADTLNESLTAGFFEISLSIADLPENSIHNLIGRAVYLIVSDDVGINVKSDERYLTRVIDETPVVLFPTGLQTVPEDTIEFIWERVRLSYWFTYTIEIFQINLGLLTKVTELNEIASDKTIFAFPNNLPVGDYVWILTVKDIFGNSSSSKEGTFHVNM